MDAMDTKQHFALCGGDRRIELLRDLLCREGHEAVLLLRGGAADRMPRPGEIVVLPSPALREGRLNAPVFLTPEELFSALAPGTLVLAPEIGARLRAAAEAAGVTLRSYADEAYLVENAALTVEGALAAALTATEDALRGSRAVVAGAGRIGKLLALGLHSLGARVILTARKEADLAWARALGLEAVPTAELPRLLGEADLVCNTVPAPIFGAAELAALGESVPLLELAGAPGGVDRACKDDPRIKRLPGLPGKIAPLAAARAIYEAMFRQLEKERPL